MNVNLKATIIACIFSLLLSIAGAYGVLKTTDTSLSKDVIYNSEQIKKNHDSIEKLGDKVGYLETTIPLILDGVTTIKQDISILKNSVIELEVKVGILNDRSDRSRLNDPT